MVNENIKPINKKPFELVQELKDEHKIPSFEEFLKNYEYDANLNYDDLSGGDLREVKGYGPCNICNKETRWVDLRMSCAAPGCVNTSPFDWTHSTGCGSILQISNKCKIRCSGCEFNCRVTDCCYNIPACSNHPGVYKEITCDSFTRVLNLDFRNYDSRGKEVVKDLLIYLWSHNE